MAKQGTESGETASSNTETNLQIRPVGDLNSSNCDGLVSRRDKFEAEAEG